MEASLFYCPNTYHVMVMCFILVKTYYSRQINKMIKHTQTIRRQFADKLFERV